MEATKPVWQTSRAKSVVLQRDNGSSCADGNSQAQALICTTNSGGKSPGATRTSTLFQTFQALGKEALAPHRDHVTTGVQALCNLVVAESLCRQQNHLGPLHSKIRQRIFGCAPLQLGGFRR